MTKKFLVTVSDDPELLFGVRFGCSFLKPNNDYAVTLLHISRLGGNQMEKVLLDSWQKPKGTVTKQLSPGAGRAMERAKYLVHACRIHTENPLQNNQESQDYEFYRHRSSKREICSGGCWKSWCRSSRINPESGYRLHHRETYRQN